MYVRFFKWLDDCIQMLYNQINISQLSRKAIQTISYAILVRTDGADCRE